MHFSTLLFLAVTLAGRVLGDGLNYRAHGFVNGTERYFGTSMNGGIPGDLAVNAIATNTSDFGQYTCEYQMKWGYTEPQQNK